MSRVFLIRHGPTHARTMVGWTDMPADLSDHTRIANLSAALPQAPIISSDLCRARDTGDAIAHGRPRLPDDAALREMHFGRWENLSWQDAEQDNPEIARELWSNPGTVAPPGGESWDALAARVVPALHRAITAAQDAKGPDSDCIIVAHFGVILTALQYAGQWDTAYTLSHRIEPLSLSTIKWGATPQVERINQLL